MANHCFDGKCLGFYACGYFYVYRKLDKFCMLIRHTCIKLKLRENLIRILN